MKSFDELFNEFFNRIPKPNSLHDEIMKIIESLATPKMSNHDSEEMIVKTLGIDLDKPTSVEEHIQDGMRFTKLIWDTPNGKFVKIVVTDVVDSDTALMSTGPKQKSLDEQLQEAVDNEDYELAIKLRDQIKAQSEQVEKPKRKTKKSL